MNRIQQAIDRATIKLATKSLDEHTRLHNLFKVEEDEIINCQQLQSRAFASKLLNLEEAQTLFKLYGSELPTPEKWEKLTLAEKFVGTMMAAELGKKGV